MVQKKKNILEKIVKKDYNNELEKILEQKQFDENVKSTLLSILYKIEVAYKDIETVKKDVENKDEYISNILEIIQNDCKSIKIVKMNEKDSKIPQNKSYIINKENKEIVAYPIERKILYAISKLGNKEKIIKDEYFFIDETLSNLINVGNNINIVEPLRDFNGYSWTNIPHEIESIDHNLIYQNLRIIIGHKFLNKWMKNNEFIIDYFDVFKEKLENKYDKENAEKIVDIISKISILLTLKFETTKVEEFSSKKKDIEKQLKKIENRSKFVEEKTKEKIEITNKIKEIDTIINNKELLEEEYKKRNERLPLNKKIFSMKVLSKIMQEEKDQYLKNLQEVNKILNPINFVEYKNELEEKYKYLKIIDIQDKEKELEKLKIEFQELFLEVMKININKVETRQDIEKIIYDFRYYLLIPYNYEKRIQNIEVLQERVNEISKLIIDKAIELKVLEEISKDKETNYEILKNIFTVRIIRLEDAYIKLIKEKDRYFVQIFDENIFEEKVEIQKPKNLEIKPNKKVAIMSH